MGEVSFKGPNCPYNNNTFGLGRNKDEQPHNEESDTVVSDSNYGEELQQREGEEHRTLREALGGERSFADKTNAVLFEEGTAICKEKQRKEGVKGTKEVREVSSSTQAFLGSCVSEGLQNTLVINGPWKSQGGRIDGATTLNLSLVVGDERWKGLMGKSRYVDVCGRSLSVRLRDGLLFVISLCLSCVRKAEDRDAMILSEKFYGWDVLVGVFKDGRSAADFVPMPKLAQGKLPLAA
ncbi:hypothetical protein VNO80_07067 [Phaseolus coccineus]|uniref:Uncharacterized protein n=1 Tax=Phaseolus coccineus TaxID=3886 RepID=A0AAN9RJJ7_PHACN